MKILLIITTLILVSSASIIREIRVKTADCSDCGMTPFFGQLSAKVKWFYKFWFEKKSKNFLFSKVCGQGMAPALCCVAVNLQNRESNFQEGKVIFLKYSFLKKLLH